MKTLVNILESFFDNTGVTKSINIEKLKLNFEEFIEYINKFDVPEQASPAELNMFYQSTNNSIINKMDHMFKGCEGVEICIEAEGYGVIRTWRYDKQNTWWWGPVGFYGNTKSIVIELRKYIRCIKRGDDAWKLGLTGKRMKITKIYVR